MNAGALDTRITIQTITTAPNDSGDVVETPSTLTTVWASMRFLKGREFVEAKKLYDEVECVFEIRYSTDVASVNSTNRIIAKYLHYDIVGDPIPVPGGRPEKILIYAKRRESGLVAPDFSVAYLSAQTIDTAIAGDNTFTVDFGGTVPFKEYLICVCSKKTAAPTLTIDGATVALIRNLNYGNFENPGVQVYRVSGVKGSTDLVVNLPGGAPQDVGIFVLEMFSFSEVTDQDDDDGTNPYQVIDTNDGGILLMVGLTSNVGGPFTINTMVSTAYEVMSNSTMQIALETETSVASSRAVQWMATGSGAMILLAIK